jgi:hypothetical protein
VLLKQSKFEFVSKAITFHLLQENIKYNFSKPEMKKITCWLLNKVYWATWVFIKSVTKGELPFDNNVLQYCYFQLAKVSRE